ncbi:MAG: DUF839 domain-containing protein, partial [Zoogloeaceae bacterium]|nr:DUF839 domain-containing protein [Zoogloeaceae bacterium]
MPVFDHDDLPSNLSDNEHFQQVVERTVSRRGFLKSGLGLGAAAFLSSPLIAQAVSGQVPASPVKSPAIGFAPVAASSGDSIVVPDGYKHQIIARWGEALFADSPAWAPDGSNTGEEQGRQIGDNHDGMHFFPLNGKSGREGLLVMNHEYTNYEYLFGAAFMDDWNADKVLKAQNAHGASVLHIRQHAGNWEIVLNSKYNRRITGNTPMRISGPAAGHALMRTSMDPDGINVLGTLNN